MRETKGAGRAPRAGTGREGEGQDLAGALPVLVASAGAMAALGLLAWSFGAQGPSLDAPHLTKADQAALVLEIATDGEGEAEPGATEFASVGGKGRAHALRLSASGHRVVQTALDDDSARRLAEEAPRRLRELARSLKGACVEELHPAEGWCDHAGARGAFGPVPSPGHRYAPVASVSWSVVAPSGEVLWSGAERV